MHILSLATTSMDGKTLRKQLGGGADAKYLTGVESFQKRGIAQFVLHLVQALRLCFSNNLGLLVTVDAPASQVQYLGRMGFVECTCEDWAQEHQSLHSEGFTPMMCPTPVAPFQSLDCFSL